MLSDVLRMELKPFDIDVITVQPAAVKTEIERRSAEGIEAYNDPDSFYRPYYDGIRKRFEGNEGVAISAEAFARQITGKLLAERPPRVITGGGRSGLLQFLARLPVRWRDGLMRREYGL
jgi:short-subunit dehydrogenase